MESVDPRTTGLVLIDLHGIGGLPHQPNAAAPLDVRRVIAPAADILHDALDPRLVADAQIDEGATGGNGMSGNWDYEPDNPERVLSALLPRYVEFSIYHALLESSASFQSAQMIAMSAATDAANDLVKDLSLEANKARQAEITKEIAEISGAAEAIRGASG